MAERGEGRGERYTQENAEKVKVLLLLLLSALSCPLASLFILSPSNFSSFGEMGSKENQMRLWHQKGEEAKHWYPWEYLVCLLLLLALLNEW